MLNLMQSVVRGFSTVGLLPDCKLIRLSELVDKNNEIMDLKVEKTSQHKQIATLKTDKNKIFDELTLVKNDLKTQTEDSNKTKENLEKNIQELKSKLTESDQKVSKSLIEIEEKSKIIEGHLQTAIQTETDYNIKIKTLETNFQRQLTEKDNYAKELELAMENLRKAKTTPTTQRVASKRTTKK